MQVNVILAEATRRCPVPKFEVSMNKRVRGFKKADIEMAKKVDKELAEAALRWRKRRMDKHKQFKEKTGVTWAPIEIREDFGESAASKAPLQGRRGFLARRFLDQRVLQVMYCLTPEDMKGRGFTWRRFKDTSFLRGRILWLGRRTGKRRGHCW